MNIDIATSHVYPPIPVRTYDWCAWDANRGADCSPYGWGSTEEEAIADLLENLEYEREEAAEARRDARRDDAMEGR